MEKHFENIYVIFLNLLDYVVKTERKTDVSAYIFILFVICI